MNEHVVTSPDFRRVSAIAAAEPITNVFMAFSAAEAGQKPRLFRLPLSEDLAERFRGDAASFIHGLADALTDDLELHPYDPSTEPGRDQMEWVTVADVAALKEAVEALANPAAVETLDPNADLPGKPVFTVVSLTAIDQKSAVHLFQPSNASRELTQRGILVSWMDSAFAALVEKTFLFDEFWPVIVAEGHAFVLKRPAFERMFGLGRAVLERKDAIAQAITAVIPLDDAAPFIAYCSKRQRALQKLEMVARRPYFAALTIDKLEKAITAVGLSIEVVGEGDARKLVCNRKSASAIVSLLNDDFLISLGISDQAYKVSAKRQLPKAGS